MKKMMLIAGVLASSMIGAGWSAAAGPLESVTIRAKPASFTGWTVSPRGDSARFELELGDTVDSTVIEIAPSPGDTRQLAVQFQVETSVTIMNDGPHLDLVDWKHHTSEWINVERIDELRFRMPAFEAEYGWNSHFPDYTVDELVRAAEAAGGERWSNLVRQHPDPDDGRVGASISTVRIRVRAYDPAPTSWVTLFTIEVGVPMGC